MSIEIWIVLVLGASLVSAWIGFSYARRGGPTRAQMDALAHELDQARQEAETVQSGVNEHFEQSAVLFGNLAKDYREFLEHFSESARSLGLPESRARELLEQGYQPLIAHSEIEDDVRVVEASAEVETAEPPLMEDVVETAPAPSSNEVAPAESDLGTGSVESTDAAAIVDRPIPEVIVEMPDEGASGSESLDDSEDDREEVVRQHAG